MNIGNEEIIKMANRGEAFRTEAACIKDDQYRRATTLLKSIADRQRESVAQTGYWTLVWHEESQTFRHAFWLNEAPVGSVEFYTMPKIDAIQSEFEAAGLKMDWLL